MIKTKTAQSAAQNAFHVRYSTPASSVVVFRDVSPKRNKKAVERSKAKANAIYTYLRAVRALGKQKVTTADVAGALDLPESEVRKIMSSMEDRGVRAG